MLSTLTAKLSLIGIILAVLLGGGIYTYNKYLDYRKEQEFLIRQDERRVVEYEINDKTKKLLDAEKKKVKDLQKQLATIYAEIDIRADLKVNEVRKAKTEEEVNKAYKGVIACLEKSC